jgi:DNA-directed RNA polymerase specialized sigma24 family protein
MAELAELQAERRRELEGQDGGVDGRVKELESKIAAVEQRRRELEGDGWEAEVIRIKNGASWPARARGLNNSDIDDIGQEVILRALQRGFVGALEPGCSAEEFHRVTGPCTALNTTSRHMQRERPRGIVPLDASEALHVPDQNADFEKALVAKMAAASLTPLIDGLPEIYRVAAMAWLEADGKQGDAIESMCRTLRIAPATAKVRIQRAMKMLHERACACRVAVKPQRP